MNLDVQETSQHVSVTNNRDSVYIFESCKDSNRIRSRWLKNDQKSVEFINGKKTTGLPAIGKIITWISKRKHGPWCAKRGN